MSPRVRQYDVPGFRLGLTKSDYDTLVWAAELEDDEDGAYAIADSHTRRVALRRCVRFELMEDVGRVPVYCERHPECRGARGKCLNNQCGTMRRGFGLTELGRQWIKALDDMIMAQEGKEI